MENHVLAQMNPSGAALGLAQVDSAAVAQLTAQLESGSLEQLYSFGRELGAGSAAHTDGLLEQVKSKDLDVIGARLSEIVVAAKSLNMGALSDKRSRIPLIGGLIDKVRLKGGEFVVRFQDVRTQVDSLVDQVQGMQAGLARRVETLEQSFESVKQEHAMLGAHIAAGEAALASMGASLATRSALAHNDPVAAQAVQDTRAALAALEKRIADMRMLQHSAMQQLPMIRIVQANNRMLIEKFYSIKELTVPAWKRQFALALALNEQKNAVELANNIDDATNAFLRENARLLKDNTIATAKANQRLVIDIDTLAEVHESLMSTVQEVVRINEEGLARRSDIVNQLRDMRQQLTGQIGAA